MYDGTERKFFNEGDPHLRLKGYRFRFINRRIPRIKKLLLSYQDSLCFYCDKKLLPLTEKHKSPLPHNYPTLEHLKPRHGHNFQRDYRMSNLVMACHTCNQEKGGKNWTEFFLLKNPIHNRIYAGPHRRRDTPNVAPLFQALEARGFHFGSDKEEPGQPHVLQGLGDSGNRAPANPPQEVAREDAGRSVPVLRVNREPDPGPRDTEESWWEEWPA